MYMSIRPVAVVVLCPSDVFIRLSSVLCPSVPSSSSVVCPVVCLMQNYQIINSR